MKNSMIKATTARAHAATNIPYYGEYKDKNKSNMRINDIRTAGPRLTVITLSVIFLRPAPAALMTELSAATGMIPRSTGKRRKNQVC